MLTLRFPALLAAISCVAFSAAVLSPQSARADECVLLDDDDMTQGTEGASASSDTRLA